MTEQGKPVLKPMSEADAEALQQIARDASPEAFKAALRMHGYLAPEPVDPLLVEAKAAVEEMTGHEVAWTDERVSLVLAALRRGMELRPELTRERVQDAAFKAFHFYPRNAEADAFLAALTEPQP